MTVELYCTLWVAKNSYYIIVEYYSVTVRVNCGLFILFNFIAIRGTLVWSETPI